MNKLFITGASGFIGSHVVRHAFAANCQVAILAMPTDPLWRLKDMADHLTVIQGDLDHPETYRLVLSAWKPEACIHLAWYAEPGKYLHAMENLACLEGSLALFQELIRIDCRHIVMAGTCAEYALQNKIINEDSPTDPATLYAACKLSLNLIGRQLAARTGVKFTWGRVFYLYGPHEDPRRVVPALIHSLSEGKPFPATSGEQVRDYLHVEDVASAFYRLAEHGTEGVFNICSGNPITMRRLMEIIGEIMRHGELIRFGEAPAR
ncbi:MAG: NAD(P)-dependent oxidoreductase, partial [Kiritimatiellia bacterium]|nr:NAD(P)-dependent oxidoreductase [Kiritimatiellia bacterium]